MYLMQTWKPGKFKNTYLSIQHDKGTIMAMDWFTLFNYVDNKRRTDIIGTIILTLARYTSQSKKFK